MPTPCTTMTAWRLEQNIHGWQLITRKTPKSSCTGVTPLRRENPGS